MGHPERHISPPLALTMGDPAGIGPDITLLAWRKRATDDIPPFVALGDPELYRARAHQLGLDVPVSPLASPGLLSAIDDFTRALPVLPVPLSKPAITGKPDRTNADAVVNSIRLAVGLVYDGAASAVVTNPINKHLLYASGFEHPGHTEFLGALARECGDDANPVMMLVCEEIRAVPVTVHIPLKDVPAALTKERIVLAVKTTARALASRYRLPSPRIAVTGLNPHAGEEGSLGTEEREIIAPAIRELRESGFEVTGPWPADTIFQERLRESYDAVVTMYHDQALIPVKTLAFDTAVNVTIGLPFLRTSPDHGTAYELAGSGDASPSSLIEALRLAAKLGNEQEVAA